MSTPRRRTSQNKASPGKRTISFDEVYANGDAEYKHIIVQHPKDNGSWYILKCDEHGVHFNLNPLHGAAKHLHSEQHKHLSKEHNLAIQLLGHLVFDCDAELAEKNNAAVRKAFEKGYKPYNRNTMTKAERLGLGAPLESESPTKQRPPDQQHGAEQIHHQEQAPSSDAPKQKQIKTFTGITDPIAGELYLGYWSKDRSKYGVLVLPWGDLSTVGLGGTLATTNLLAKNVPKCYNVDRSTQKIIGWAKGYEDDGPLITRREFPVMYFDGHRCGPPNRFNILKMAQH
jgi:hypothetical protein